jgi:hypothetical protein
MRLSRLLDRLQGIPERCRNHEWMAVSDTQCLRRVAHGGRDPQNGSRIPQAGGFPVRVQVEEPILSMG